MKITREIIVIIFIATLKLQSFGFSPVSGDSVRLEILMSGKMLDDINMKAEFINSMNVTGQGHILLSSANQFYLLGWGGIKAVGPKTEGIIGSFAYTSNGYLMTIHDKDLCFTDSLGQLVKLFDLPGTNMGLTTGENALYLFDRNKEQKKHGLYILPRGKKFFELIDIPTAIISVLEMKNMLLFATENKMYSVNLNNNDLKPLVTLPGIDREIISITNDSKTNIIYFSSSDAIYSLKDTSVVCLSDKFGGILQYYNDGLLVFSPEKKFLIRLMIERSASPEVVSKRNFPEVKQTADTLTNATVINLVKSKISDNFIISIINSSPANFILNVDAMIDLSNQNVSSAVIMAMKNAMKRKKVVNPNVSTP